MNQEFLKIKNISGEFELPGDKSISHRALIFSAMADGKSTIKNLADSVDVKTTAECLKNIGVKFESDSGNLIVHGVGFKGFNKPDEALYCGNSGTTARLLSGLFAAQDFSTILKGDESLSKRPMKRIIEPLEMMGCKIESNSGTLPLKIKPVDNLKSINYELPVASAQVKSAILLAGLHLNEITTVIELKETRDHTERMLNLTVEKYSDKIIIPVSKKNYPEHGEFFVPGDISSAAYFIVLTLLSKNSSLVLKNVSINKTRTAYLYLLKQMGADISIIQKGNSYNEPLGDVIVKSSGLKNIEIDSAIIPLIIDEIPILTIAGIFAEGEFVIRNAKELRIKESDRINSICVNLKTAGLNIEEFDDGFSVNGNIEKGSKIFKSFNDHRIAMSFAVLSSLIDDDCVVENFECVSISNPKFLEQLKSVADFS
ncbi:3-phosphoshikimate 1-carboxyvinyltransferase [bacterium BMS3Abin03]|nr:3-phosphoshikimate 1-carboxyvinyltransferase [bacterium BMS3Abin03]